MFGNSGFSRPFITCLIDFCLCFHVFFQCGLSDRSSGTRSGFLRPTRNEQHRIISLKSSDSECCLQLSVVFTFFCFCQLFQTLDVTNKQAETNFSQLQKETAVLAGYRANACKCWIYVLMFVVCLTFIGSYRNRFPNSYYSTGKRSFVYLMGSSVRKTPNLSIMSHYTFIYAFLLQGWCSSCGCSRKGCENFSGKATLIVLSNWMTFQIQSSDIDEDYF
jgi:hypothetical protein